MLDLTVSPQDRAALLRKYSHLLSLRRRRDEGVSAAPSREELRALAHEFPGALRELDLLGAGELQRRVQVLERLAQLDARSTARGAEERQTEEASSERAEATQGAREKQQSKPEPADRNWIAWIAAYHAWMRAALLIKGEAGRARRPAPDNGARLPGVPMPGAAIPKTAERPTTDVTVVWDEAFARAVMHPRAGRLAVVVLEVLSREFGVPAQRISDVLFPPRRPSPYTFSS